MKAEILILSATILVSDSACSQVQQSWVARFANGNATALKIDNAGNIYVTGSAAGTNGTTDFVTIKYDGNGNALWMTPYAGPSNSVDSASALAIDGAGNAYVTGLSGNAIATIKYDSSGHQIWVARYQSPQGTVERPGALAVDSAGNIYVSSSVTLPNVGDYLAGDYLTLKYDSAGNQLWAVRYDGPAHLLDRANAMAVDSAGYVYVTGSSVSACMGAAESGIRCASDYATVKYAPDGQLLWVARYRPWDPSANSARAIALDSAGRVYVTGESHIDFCGGSSSGAPNFCPADYATMAYDENGNELWTARYNSPTDDQDTATAIALDRAGNVLVTGSSTFLIDGDVGTDFVTIKYDPLGNELWRAPYGEPSHGNQPFAMAVDVSDNIYVTGSSSGGTYTAPDYTGLDYATVKYDPNGNQLWVARYNGPGNGNDVSSGIALDTSGNVYLTGKSHATNDDFATVKYVQINLPGLPTIVTRPQSQSLTEGQDVTFSVTAEGSAPLTYQWRLNGTNIPGATNLNLSLSYVQAAQAGEYSVIVSNSVGVTISPAAALVVSPSMQLAWLAAYGGDIDPFDSVNAMTVDSAGNVYVTGYVATQSNGDADYATVKYDTSGNQRWAARYNGTGNANDSPFAIAADPSGNIYVTGFSRGTTTGEDYATVKYGPEGNQVWVRRYNRAGSANERAYAILLDNGTNVYVTGSSGTLKYDANGNQRWAISDVGGYALAVDGAGNIYVAGSSPTGPAVTKHNANGAQLWLAQSTNGYPIALALDGSTNVYVTTDSALLKYDKNGNLLWRVRHAVAIPDFVEARASAVDSAGNAYVAGYGRPGVLTLKYGSDGHFLWAGRYAGPAESEDSPWAVALDTSGNVYVTGYITVYTPNSLRLNYDVATLKYDAAGHQLAAERAGNSGDQQAYALALDAAGNVYVSGFSGGDGFLTAKYVQHPIATRLGIDASRTNRAIHLTLTGEAQRRYGIQASGDLRHWSAATNLFNDAGTAEVGQTADQSARFYRAMKLP